MRDYILSNDIVKLGEGKLIRGHIVVIVGSRHIITCAMDPSGQLDHKYHLIEYGEESESESDEFGSFESDEIKALDDMVRDMERKRA